MAVRRPGGTVLLSISRASRFSQAIGRALTWSIYTAPLHFAKHTGNAFKLQVEHASSFASSFTSNHHEGQRMTLNGVRVTFTFRIIFTALCWTKIPVKILADHDSESLRLTVKCWVTVTGNFKLNFRLVWSLIQRRILSCSLNCDFKLNIKNRYVLL